MKLADAEIVNARRRPGLQMRVAGLEVMVLRDREGVESDIRKRQSDGRLKYVVDFLLATASNRRKNILFRIGRL